MQYFVEWPANASLGLECLEYSITGRLQTDFLWNLFELFFGQPDETKKLYGDQVDSTNILKSTGVYPFVFFLLLICFIYTAFLKVFRGKNLNIRRQY